MSVEVTSGLHTTRLFRPVIQVHVPSGWTGEELDASALVLFPPDKAAEVAIDSTEPSADPDAVANTILHTPEVDLQRESLGDGIISLSGLASEDVTFNDSSGRLSLQGYMNEIYVLKLGGDTITVWLLAREQDWQPFRAEADPVVRSLLPSS